MQHLLRIDAQTGSVLQQLRIPHPPKSEDGGGCGIEWHISIACRLSRLSALIDGILVAYGQSEFADFATLNLNGIRRKTLTDFARINHSTVSFLLARCRLEISAPRQRAASHDDDWSGSVVSTGDLPLRVNGFLLLAELVAFQAGTDMDHVKTILRTEIEVVTRECT
jgi:hypothetical protein